MIQPNAETQPIVATPIAVKYPIKKAVSISPSTYRRVQRHHFGDVVHGDAPSNYAGWASIVANWFNVSVTAYSLVNNGLEKPEAAGLSVHFVTSPIAADLRMRKPLGVAAGDDLATVTCARCRNSEN